MLLLGSNCNLPEKAVLAYWTEGLTYGGARGKCEFILWFNEVNNDLVELEWKAHCVGLDLL